ncbi:hypothetical protein [Altererythrobacter lauratis]|uniref:TonB C-terminal domain-containing protein n=1 Tax=Alteraurantiacibacter lauratis TaxID=2054627 RepID=A0ABV7EAN8_9SPHN
MKKTTLWLAAAAAALSPLTAHAQDNARVFQPSGPWTADFGDDYCRLMRSFSDGRETVSISFEKIDTGPTMRLMVLGNAVSIYRGSDQIGVDFVPSANPRRLPFARSTSTDGQQLLIFSGVMIDDGSAAPAGENAGPPPATIPTAAERDAQELARGTQITALSLTSGLTTPVRIETGSLRNAMEVLQTCGYDLLSIWGLDPEKHRTLSRPAFPPPGPHLANGTIPFGEFSRLAGGSNMVRVMISAEGRPTACEIHYPTLSANVNTRICAQIMDNARFQPALDAEGQPMASYWTVPPFALMGPPPGRR